MLCNHSIQAVHLDKLSALLHKARKQIALAIRKVLLHIVRQHRIHAGAAHIRRIGADHVIFLRQNPGKLHHRFQLRHVQPDRGMECSHHLVQPRRCCHRHQRTVGVGELELLHELPQTAAHHGILHTHDIGEVRKVGLVLPTENAAVVLSCFHHHRKICQLIRTAVDVQPVEVVPQDRHRRITLRPAAGSVNVHQHIERIDEDMAAAHARVCCRSKNDTI